MQDTAPRLPYLSITHAGSRVAGGNVRMFSRGAFPRGVPRFLLVFGKWPEIGLSFTDAVEGSVRQLVWRGSHWQASLPTATLDIPPELEIRSRESRAVCRQISQAEYVFDFESRLTMADRAFQEGRALLERLEELLREYPGLERALGLQLPPEAAARRR